MSAEWFEPWQPQQQQQGDAFGGMWEDADAGWGFDGVDAGYDAPADWTPWDEPPGADRSLNDFDPYFSSSTAGDDFTPQVHSQDLHGGHERDSQTHDHSGSTSLARMGNTASAATNGRDARPDQSTSRHPQPSAASRHRAPVASHSDDWLGHLPRGGQTSFGYIPDHLFERLSESPELGQASPSQDEQSEGDVPPATRRRQRGSVVDLTTDLSSPQQSAARVPKSLKRTAQDAEEGRSSKRTKQSLQHVDEVDMTEEAPSAEEELLQAQQEKAVAAQQAEQEPSGLQKIGQRQCVICMEAYTNATVTRCGHIYCHECLTQALLAGEKNNDRAGGNCPVCRKPVSRKKAGHMLPLAFMKKSAFKGKARQGVGLLGSRERRALLQHQVRR